MALDLTFKCKYLDSNAKLNFVRKERVSERNDDVGARLMGSLLNLGGVPHAVKELGAELPRQIVPAEFAGKSAWDVPAEIPVDSSECRTVGRVGSASGFHIAEE